jgi:putative membrane protein insertion efficiency factor
MTVVARILSVLVRLYQLTLSPLLGGQCRFYPSCSAYALDALAIHGAVRGSALAGKRLLRCHPWNPGGYDPVPECGCGHPSESH